MSLNRVTLNGNVGKDPEVRYLDSGVAVALFSLATTEKGYTTQTGQQIPEQTEWHSLVAWRGLAQTVEKLIHKGDKIYVEGKLKYRTYEGQDGVKRSVTEIYVEKIETIPPKGESKPLPPDPGVPVSQASAHTAATANPAPSQPAPQAQQGQMDFSAEPQDDLPF